MPLLMMNKIMMCVGVCVCVMYGGVLWNERKDRVMDIKFQRLEKPQAKTYDYYSLFT